MSIDFQPIGDDIDFQAINTPDINTQTPAAALAKSNADIAMEGSSAYPNSKITDPTINDASVLAGAGQTASLMGKAIPSAIGSALEATPATENIIPTIQRTADNQLLKSLGSNRGQVKALGTENAREAAQAGRDIGLDNIMSTQIGREKTLQGALDTTGKDIGQAREAAGNAPFGIPEQIKQDLMAKYGTKGVYSNEAGKVNKALNDVQRLGGEGVMNPPTHAGYAKAATFLNDAATKAAMTQPTNATTDVANKLSQLNNEGIVQSLGSDKGKEYLDALNKMSNLSSLQPMQETGAARQMGSQGNSAGGGFLRTLYNQTQRPMVLRGASKALNAGANALNAPLPNVVPAATTDLYAYLSHHPEEVKKFRDQLGQ